MQEELTHIKQYLLAFGKQVAVGLGIGLTAGGIAVLFGWCLGWANKFASQTSWSVWLLPVLGLVIVFLYRRFGGEKIPSTDMVIAAIHSSTNISFQMAPLIFISTVLTQLGRGSAGREGAAIQLGGSIADSLAGLFPKLSDNDRRMFVLCGMSAGFSALFQAPAAAAIFSLEVVSVGIMHYSALVPCMVSALTASYLAGLAGLGKETFPLVMTFTPWGLVKVGVVAMGCALISACFCRFSQKLSKKIHAFPNPYVRIFGLGLGIACVVQALSWQEYMGSGMSLIQSIFDGGDVVWYGWLVKVLLSAVTIGAGFKGGEIVPSLCIGACFGAAAAPILHLSVFAGAAAGMTAMFAGVTNCPITALFLGLELFGMDALPCVLASSAVAYMLSGYSGLYHAQKLLYSKTETTYINTKVK